MCGAIATALRRVDSAALAAAPARGHSWSDMKGISEITSRHRERHQPSGFGFSFADRIEYAHPAHWDAVVELEIGADGSVVTMMPSGGQSGK